MPNLHVVHGERASNAASEKRERLQKRFEEILKGKFDIIPEHCSGASVLPGVEGMLVLPAPPAKGQEKPTSAYVTVRYRTQKGTRATASYVIMPDGSFIGRVPLALPGVTREDLFDEALTHLERWGVKEKKTPVTLFIEIFPPEEWEKTGKGKGGGEGGDYPADERIEYLRERPELVDWFDSLPRGPFKEYHGFIFPTFVVLECPWSKNAAYFIDDIPPVEISPKASVEERRRIIEAQPWAQGLDKITKFERYKIAGPEARLVHFEDWKTKMQEKLDERFAKAAAAKAAVKRAA